LEYGKPLKKENRKKGLYPVFGSNGIVGYHDSYLVEGPFIIVGRKGSAGAVTYSGISGYPIDTTFFVKIKDVQCCNLKYLYFQMLSLGLDKVNIQSGVPGLNRNDAYKIKIPLPPLEVQEQIVAELDNYQKIIDGAWQVVGNYRPHIDIDPEWEMVELGDDRFFNIEAGGTPSSKEKNYWDGDVLWATLVDLPSNDHISFIQETKRKITDLGLEKSSAKLIKVNSVIVSTRATIGRVAVNLAPIATNQGFKNIIIKEEKKVDSFFVALMVKKLEKRMIALATGGTFKELSKSKFSEMEIPLPDIAIQQELVVQIKKEQKIIESNKILIEMYEQKIKDRIAKVWNK